jgi:YggT family protein
VEIICALLLLFVVVLFLRAVLSWFPLRPGTPLATISGILFDLTEWALRPLRKVIPPVGMFDLSFLVLTFGLLILRQALCG